MYKIGDIIDLKEYTPCALWCKKNNATLVELQGTEKRQFQIVEIKDEEKEIDGTDNSDGG